jgi:cytokinin dehydrogenase
MIDLRRLSGVVADHPDTKQITVRAGTDWIVLCNHLAAQGRRPVCLTTNLYSSIGGTLAVGGFGDTTHRFGLQTASVLGLTLVTPDGEVRELGPDDELFQFALAGRGQLGAITSVTMRTIDAPFRLMMRRIEWRSLYEFVRDGLIISSLGLYDFVRARVFWRPGNSVEAYCARFTDERGGLLPRYEILSPADWTTVAEGDLLELQRSDLSASWTYGCPAVEMVLPLPGALQTWDQRINPKILRSGLVPYLQSGASIGITPRQSIPLAPTPESNYSLMIALRPAVPVEHVAAFVDAARAIAAEAIDAGGRLYLMSIEPDRERLARQFGDAWHRWIQLKCKLDPLGLCNPGLLTAPTSALSASA